MRIAFVAGFAWEPKGTVRARAFPLGRALVRAGHHVRIFVIPYDNLAHSGVETVKNGVELVNIRIGAPGPSWLGALRNLWSQLKRFDPDVIHVYKPKGFAGLAGSLLVWNGYKNWVLDCDDWEGWGGWNDVLDRPYLFKQWIDWQERWLMRKAPVVTVASRILENRSRHIRSGDEPVLYVPNCASDAVTDLSPETSPDWQTTPAEKDIVSVFYAGHYEPGDDLEFVAEVALSLSQNKNIRFDFVGDGPELAWFRKRLATTRAAFWGRQSLARYWALLNAADIAIFPYPDHAIYRSKCSARVIDYMQAGKPIVTTALGQNEEYLENEKSALLIAPGQVAAFASAIKRLVDSPATRSAFGKAARERLADHFNWEMNALPSMLRAYSYVCCPGQEHGLD